MRGPVLPVQCTPSLEMGHKITSSAPNIPYDITLKNFNLVNTSAVKYNNHFENEKWQYTENYQTMTGVVKLNYAPATTDKINFEKSLNF